MSSQKGYSTQEKDDRLSAQFQTIEPVRELQYGSTVVAHQFVYEVGTDAAEAGSTAYSIVASAHAALKGDVILLTSGALSGREVKVWEVSANLITLAETLPSAIAAAVTFRILRHKYPSVDSTGAVNITGSVSFSEEATAADGGALPALVKVIGGYDGSAVQVIKTNAAGELEVDVLSSALPTGAATEATLATLATEATVATLATEATVSTLATEATVATLATEATVSTLATEATVATLATEATVSTLATEATVATLATEATVSTLATEATVATLATEATVATLATAAAQTDGTQKSQIVDGAGNVISSTSNALDVNLKSPVIVDVNLDEADDSVAVFGYDGTVNRAIKTDASGELQVDILSSALPTGAATETTLNAIKTAVELIDNTVSGNELQVDIVSSALPSGAATETTLLAIEADTTSLAGCVSGSEVQVDVVSSALPTGAATETTLADIKTAVQLIDNAISGNEMQVDVVSSALPTGAATEATLATLATEATVSTLATEATVLTLGTETTLLAVKTAVEAIENTVSGSELQVDIVTSALPTGAATSAAQTDGSQKTQIVDGSGNVIGSTGNALDVNVKTPITVDVSLSEANDSVAVFGSDGTTNRALKTDANGELQIDVLSSALPTGAATSAKQPALGTAGTASADVITVQGIASMTALKVDGSAVTQPVSAASLPLPTGAATSAAQTDGTQKSQIVDGSGNVIGSTSNALDVYVTSPISVSLSETTDSVAVFGNDGTTNRALKTDAAGELQVDVLSSALPTGAATETTLAAIKTAAELIDNAISGNEMQVDVKLIEGVIDANNTTSTPLLAGGNFTGAWTEIKDYNSINLGVFSDVASATDGLRIEYSFDGISVHHFHLWTFPGGANGIGYQLSAEFRYFRINYTNGAASQATFLLQSNLKPTALFPSSYRASQTFSAQSQVILTKGIIVGETTGGGGGYVAVKVNPSGALVADVTGTVAATQSGTWNINNVSGTISLPTGAATEATLADIKTAVELIDNAVSGSELQVDIVAALPSGTNTIGKVDVNTLSVVDLLDAGILDTSSTNIAGSASNPTQVVASTAAATKKLQLLDTTGAFIGVYTGAALSEVLQFVMGPGSDQTIEHSIPAGTRISLKRLDSTTAVSSGIVAINFIG
jgi:hypothetical protein